MSRLGRDKQREHERAEGSPGSAATPIDVRVPEGDSGVRAATVDGSPVVAAPGEEIQNAVLNRLHRLALAAGRLVLATIHDRRLGYSVPSGSIRTGSSHLAAEPVPTATDETPVQAPEAPVEATRTAGPGHARPARGGAGPGQRADVHAARPAGTGRGRRPARWRRRRVSSGRRPAWTPPPRPAPRGTRAAADARPLATRSTGPTSAPVPVPAAPPCAYPLSAPIAEPIPVPVPDPAPAPEPETAPRPRPSAPAPTRTPIPTPSPRRPAASTPSPRRRWGTPRSPRPATPPTPALLAEPTVRDQRGRQGGAYGGRGTAGGGDGDAGLAARWGRSTRRCSGSVS